VREGRGWFRPDLQPFQKRVGAWALADKKTREVIYRCHQKAIAEVLAYAEREVFHSRSGQQGCVEEDVVGVIAASFTHFDSRDGDPQLHDHVVVLNRARPPVTASGAPLIAGNSSPQR